MATSILTQGGTLEANSTGTGTLFVTLTDTFTSLEGAQGWATTMTLNPLIGKGAVTGTFRVDGADKSVLGPLTTLATDNGGFLLTPGTPFVLEIELAITHTGAARTQVSADMAPIPEPGTLLLLGSGLIGLAAYSRRRK